MKQIECEAFGKREELLLKSPVWGCSECSDVKQRHLCNVMEITAINTALSSD